MQRSKKKGEKDFFMWLRGFLVVCMFMFLPASIQLIAKKNNKIREQDLLYFHESLGSN
jgi:hypothetical protein